MPNKMERFTQRARRVLSLAQEEAERLQHNYIGTEHLLLGLMREEGGVAGRVLRDLGLEQRRVEELVERMTRATTRLASTQLDLSPGTKRVLELAVDEARRMGHHYIGTEHVLLGLVRQSEGVAIDVLKRLGVWPDEVRRQTRRVLQENPAQTKPPAEPGQAKPPRPQTAQIETQPKRNDEIVYSLRIKDKFLPKLLSRLASEDLHRNDMPAVIEELFSEVLIEDSLVMTEALRTQLLDSFLAPFKPIDDGKRHVHVVISDKTNGQTYADIKLPLTQVIEGIGVLARAIGDGRTGKMFDFNDKNNNIAILIEDEQDAESNS